jgi:uncharacterized membrane protein
MTSKTIWRLRLLTRKLWVRASLISLLAVAAALLSFVVSPYLPQDLSTDIGAEAVDKILAIIASSMLAVTTFSLSTMVTAYGAATSNVTPRATRLIMEDTTTQNVLAAFVGSFLYSLVAIITLAMGAYGARGRIVLFFVTLLVLVLIVVTLLRWIDYLMRLGRVGETTRRVEEVATRAMTERYVEPFLGGRPLHDWDAIPSGSFEIYASEIGYVSHIDTAALQKLAEKHEAEVYVLALPGTFIDTKRPLAVIAGDDEDLHEKIADAFSIGLERSFDQDPRFGLIAGWADMPAGASRLQLLGVSLLCGIGFTMSLFIGLLAFADAPHLLEAVKIGILGGSLLAGLLGYYILRVAPRETSPESGREIYGK